MTTLGAMGRECGGEEEGIPQKLFALDWSELGRSSESPYKQVWSHFGWNICESESVYLQEMFVLLQAHCVTTTRAKATATAAEAGSEAEAAGGGWN